MGAVQKLATVVIVGLVALATVLVVYLADEPNRRSSETAEQDVVSIERGTSLYITYCLQCHGPDGLGARAQDGRIGALLDQRAIYSEDQLNEMVKDPNKTRVHAIFQSDDPVQQQVAEDWLRFRIMYGVPAEPYITTKVMPAFGNDLNVEEVNDLVYLVMHGNWNYVYNTVVQQTGQAVAQEQCAKDPSAAVCKNIADAPPAYPTAPPPAGSTSGSATPAAEQSQPSGESGGAAATIEAHDISFSKKELTVKPGDTISFTNAGALEHDFVVDALGIKAIAASGETVTITVPADAKPGDYEFYCSIPGHKEAGMVGTLKVAG